MKQIPGITLLLPAVIALISGCASTQVESRLQKGLDSLGVNTAEVRLHNLERASQFGLMISAVADTILRQSSDPGVRRRAHELRMYTVPMFRQILFFPDAGAASVDGWSFAVQLRQYFTEGRGKEAFGAHQGLIVSTVATIESQFHDVGKKPEEIDKFNRIRANVEQWASSHPITNDFYARPSVIPFLEEFQVDIDHGLTGTVGNIALDVRAISIRIDLLAAQLPQEARWQAEYLMENMGVGGRLDRLDDQLAIVTESVERLTSLLEKGNLAIDIRSLRSLHSDIARLEERLSSERELVFEEIERQRLETLAQVEAAGGRILTQTTTNATDLIDHLVWRIALLAGICAVGALLLFLMFRRSGQS
ncbi:MAG: hypothetical protein OEV30_08685 [Ignavibacteria bacterium]|nr:hypothetical protein [Ignavibacteria bacterium]